MRITHVFVVPITAHCKQCTMAEQDSTAAVTEDELKRRTGEFDLEAITFLDLSDRGLRELGAVSLCLSLRVLSLSCNQLEDVRALTTLADLEELDLSANHISSLKDFDKLEKLHRLDLPGNNLSQLHSLLPLCGLQNLKSLSLQLLGTSLTNPLCLSEEYAVFMAQSFPNLHWLDGERVEGGGGKGCGLEEGVRKEREELERQLERLAAVGNGSTDGEEEVKSKRPSDEATDPLADITLNDQQAMGKISRLLSECSQTSQRVQDHIQSLQRELLH